MNDFKIVVTTKELDNDNNIRVREIDGSNFIMFNNEYAMTTTEQEQCIKVWMSERGEAQCNSKLELVSYTVERY